jgi:hypothetical protein
LVNTTEANIVRYSVDVRGVQDSTAGSSAAPDDSSTSSSSAAAASFKKVRYTNHYKKHNTYANFVLQARYACMQLLQSADTNTIYLNFVMTTVWLRCCCDDVQITKPSQLGPEVLR